MDYFQSMMAFANFVINMIDLVVKLVRKDQTGTSK